MTGPGGEGGQEEGPPFAFALVLLGIAGWVDAVGYLQLSHLFLSFMSGNTTQMAVSLGQGDWAGAGVIGAVIALFVCGVFCGTVVAGAVGAWQLPVILGGEAVLLGTALLLPAPASELPAAALPVALAMGWQNAVLQRLGTKKVSLTYVTGSLVSFGRELADAVCGRGERWSWAADLGLWLALASGAVAGAAAFAGLGFQALAIPTGAVLVLAGIATAVRIRTARR